MSIKCRHLTVGLATKFNSMKTAARSQLGNTFMGVNIILKDIDEKSSFYELSKSSEDVDVLLADPSINFEYLKNPPLSIKWIQFTYSGLDAITKQLKPGDRFQPHYIATRIGGEFSKVISDYVVAQVISLERNFKFCFEKQVKNEWVESAPSFNHQAFNQLTIGILGAGDIGMNIAKHVKLMGARVIAMKRTIPQNGNHQYPVDEFFAPSHLNEFLKSCDYFCNALPHTTETVNLLSGDVLKVCKDRRTSFINVGRGSVIDEESLVFALTNGWLHSAALDVFNEEPLPKTSLLWNLSNCVITPHCSGTSSSCINETFMENLKRFIEGSTFVYQFDWNKMY